MNMTERTFADPKVKRSNRVQMAAERGMIYNGQGDVPPSTVFIPRVFPDGNTWCALYGDSLQEGVAGFGSTPHKAILDFDWKFVSQTLKQ
jgi:hypothetical protein